MEVQRKTAQDKATADQRKPANATEVLQIGSKKELREYVAEIEKRVVEKQGADIAALVAINQILRMPNAAELIDGELKGQIKDLWIKLKASGVNVEDPPMLFGLPANFQEDEDADDVPEPEIEAAPVVRPAAGSKKTETPKPADDRGEDFPH